MDILFKNDDFVFSYRVGGILKHNGKILLQRPKNDDYAIIGGHIAAMETSMETLKREFEEELHAKIEVDNLLAIGEIYFPWGKRPCHQICLYYNVHLMDDKRMLSTSFIRKSNGYCCIKKQMVLCTIFMQPFGLKIAWKSAVCHEKTVYEKNLPFLIQYRFIF